MKAIIIRMVVLMVVELVVCDGRSNEWKDGRAMNTMMMKV